ncbi:MAG TPA: ribosome small subunit-dependent GTPase A [Gemmatimonadaceae bacterium]|jgi:ribosome biogenesis GTPase
MTARAGVVLSGTGGIWRVQLAPGEVVDASLRGRLKQDRNEQLKLAVGDEVEVEPGSHADWSIREIRPRRSRLARRSPGGSHAERVLVANVDQVIVMFAATKPEPHTRMLDRFLVIAEANHIPARIVINKIELVDRDATTKKFAPYQRAGYEVYHTSVKQRIGLEAIHETFAGRVSVLTGPSGVGKSSLMNSAFPGANLRVGEISESVQKGRHTTVGAVMLPLPGDEGGFVADTPGLREVGLSSLPADRLDLCFPELRALVDRCRFGDCRHVAEPECAVRAAVEQGDVDRDRYESYCRLLADLDAGID